MLRINIFDIVNMSKTYFKKFPIYPLSIYRVLAGSHRSL